ncbi:MAG: hypothetical protein KAV82_16880, partial [Phycisphaerae bacterium]|nr:hypothetical protein [Phycisphaerae bacterium]
MRKKMVVAAGVSLALLCTAVVFGQLLDVEVRDQSPGVVSSASANSPEWVPSRGVMGSGHPETGGAFVRNGDAEVLYSQPPNQVYAFFSAPNCFSYYGQCGSGQQSVADNFVLADRKVLEMVRFWGGCFSSPGTDQVTINLYVDSGGTPGSLVYGETGTAVTGELTGASAIGLAEVRYEATLGSTVTLEPGVSYWIEICNYNTGVWGWETGSGPGDNGLVAAETPGVNWGPLSPSSDMAFELVGSNPELLEDCNSNGIEDSTDIAMGTSLDCQPNGIPDECEVDCNENGTPDDCDIDAGTSDDINENGVPDECDAGPVDLFTWTEMDYESGGAGDWQVAADGLSVVQTINANPTFYISDFDLINSDFSGRLRVEESGGDDDFIGFVFGFTDLSGAPFYLLDWKQNSQSTNWGYAEEGLKLRKITGIPSLNELWDGEPDTHQQILAEHLSSSYGWDDGTEYEYNLTYQSDGRIHIVVRNASTWAVIWDVEYIDPDPIGVGKVGFYNFSQSLVRYSGFSQAVLLPPVAVPGGPYSFAAATSQITLDAMGSTDPDGDNGDFSDIASVQWDL